MAAFDIFFRRAKKNFEEKIGEEKTQNIFENLRNPLKLIPEEYKNDMISEIPKFLFKFSQKLDHLVTSQIEKALNHILLFTKSLAELRDKRRLEINDEILKRSNNRMRSLTDLLQGFVSTAIDKRSEVAEELKERLSDLCENQKFVENMMAMSVSYNVKNDLDFKNNNAVY